MEQAIEEKLSWIQKKAVSEKKIVLGDSAAYLTEFLHTESKNTALDTSSESTTVILQILKEGISGAQQNLKETQQASGKDSIVLIMLPFGHANISFGGDYESFPRLLEMTLSCFSVHSYMCFPEWTGLEASVITSESASAVTVHEITGHCFSLREKNFTDQIDHFKAVQTADETLNASNQLQIEQYRVSKEKLNTQIRYLNSLLYQEKRKNTVYETNPVVQMMRKVYSSRPVKFLRRKISSVPDYADESQKNAHAFTGKIDSLTEHIPDSSGSSYYKKSAITAGIITDEYVYNYYKDALNLIVITPDNYIQALEECSMLIYVSCWKGVDSSDWQEPDSIKTVCSIIRYAKKKKLKTIFQTIEDPSDYDKFLPAARESDYIFTSCAEKIEDYLHDTGNSNVFLLEYGVNPIIHNPAGITEKNVLSGEYHTESVFFAGSWMPNFPDRNYDLSIIFNGVAGSRYDLIAADRNSGLKDSTYAFPEIFQPYIIPAIDHLKLQKVHKLFDYSINVNSIKNSRTMCAMRVYELQALGCLMLSNYALSVSSEFPGLFMIHMSEEVGHILNGYSNEQIYRMQAENCNLVMSRYTVYDRLNYVFERCGIDYKFPDRRVLILCAEKTEKAVQAVAAQSFKNITLSEESETSDYSSYDYVTYFSDENDYSEDYITALMNAFKYTNADFVTKDADFNAREYNFGTGRASLAKSAVKAELFSEKVLSEKTAEGYGFKLDPFLLNEKQAVTAGQKQIAVVVPAYNNSKYLYGRCFRSLLRSSIFDKMQIYLIDDGSTDEETEDTIRELCRRYDNVTGYFFGDGGSGSASRPRNKGLEIADEPYITYLDPDNEAVGDGYSKLYDAIMRHRTDFVFGSVCRVDESAVNSRYCASDTFIENPREHLIRREMRVHSIQACLFRSGFLTENAITNPVGAYGEDSLFFHLAMLKAKSVFYMDQPVHIYYAERKDSSLNSVSKSFFEKFLICERIQVPLYEELGVLDDYKSLRLDSFVKDFYLSSLTLVRRDEQPDCIPIIEEILSLYGKKLSDYIL